MLAIAASVGVEVGVLAGAKMCKRGWKWGALVPAQVPSSTVNRNPRQLQFDCCCTSIAQILHVTLILGVAGGIRLEDRHDGHR